MYKVIVINILKFTSISLNQPYITPHGMMQGLKLMSLWFSNFMIELYNLIWYSIANITLHVHDFGNLVN